MANGYQLKLLKKSVKAWNAWRIGSVTAVDVSRLIGSVDLSRADLIGSVTAVDLSRADLIGVNLRRADLSGADLSGAELLEAKLMEARVIDADLRGANLKWANLKRANLRGSNLSGANLTGSNLSGTNLDGANLDGANLAGADLRGARASSTTRWPAFFDGVQEGVLYPYDVADLTIVFEASLSPGQVKAALEALADYYRACGGVGFTVDWELEDLLVGDRVHA